jgi:CRP-like cAMP-binding protein
MADDSTLCHVLTIDAFEKLIADDPMAGAELHRAIAKSLAARLRQATKEISLLDQLD